VLATLSSGVSLGPKVIYLSMLNKEIIEFACSLLPWNVELIDGSLEVKLPTIWTDEKQRWEEPKKRREEEKKKEDQRREIQKKKMQVREKVGKSRNTVFSQ
jgi:hypothetical protein